LLMVYVGRFESCVWHTFVDQLFNYQHRDYTI
jgi:hypothetical protein